MELNFTKMHGLGNDFAVIDCFQQEFTLTPEQIRSLGDRHFGIGFDQMLVVGPARNNNADVSYRIYNNDGGEVAQCGNGARCIAAWLYKRGIVRKEEITAETSQGLLKLYHLADGRIRVNMGIPRLEPADIPLQAARREPCYRIKINNQEIIFSAVSMGNPHAVLYVSDVDKAPVQELGAKIQQSPMFPEGVNVGFMQIMDSGHIRLRVYERGTGETLACGSGACAAVVAGRLDSKLAEETDVALPGGHLLVSWQGEGEPVWITGSATFVYEGRTVL
ncbi:MAG: diaminopimelate epimerase [Gammaproteobacteria bacterium RIFCSPLOWO2_12_47_11]|nr:MAG: diaminopimelate epimerase [Gammaproteobacteria bacterium RIFCSPLOWO2_12_47_11]